MDRLRCQLEQESRKILFVDSDARPSMITSQLFLAEVRLLAKVLTHSGALASRVSGCLRNPVTPSIPRQQLLRGGGTSEIHQLDERSNQNEAWENVQGWREEAKYIPPPLIQSGQAEQPNRETSCLWGDWGRCRYHFFSLIYWRGVIEVCDRIEERDHIPMQAVVGCKP